MHPALEGNAIRLNVQVLVLEMWEKLYQQAKA